MVDDAGHKFWYWALGSGCKIQDTGYRIQDTRFKIQDSRYKVQGTRYKVQQTSYRMRLMQIISIISINSFCKNHLSRIRESIIDLES